MRKWIALFLCIAASAFGWEAELSVDPQVARVGQQVQLTLTLQGLRDAPQPAKVQIEGLQSSLFSSRSSSIQIINGAYSQKIQYSCAVMPNRAGVFEIPLNYSYKGETKRLNTTLRVIEGADGEASSVDEMFFAKFSVPEGTVYVHQPFELDLELYNIQGTQTAGDFSLENMPTGLDQLKWSKLPVLQRVIDNKIYSVRRYQAQTQALTAGTFQFDPQLGIQAVVGRDRFYGSQTRSLELNVEPFELKILALPLQNKPARFSEGVGEFDFTVENIPQEVKQGDPITVRMRIAGSGNLTGIKAPTFTANSQLKTYDSSRTYIDDSEAVFEQVLILNDPDLKELPALQLSYFNPQTASYESVTRGPFPITVKPNGSATAQILTETTPAAARTEILGKDIIYLKPVPHTWRKLDEPRWFTQKLFLSLCPLPALLALAVGLILRKVRELHANTSELRKRGAVKTAGPALKVAEDAARANNVDAFYSEIWRAISLYFGDKLNLSAGEISEPRVLGALHHLAPDTLAAFKALLQACEQSRYGMTPKTTADEMTQMIATVRIIIKHCERKLK